MKAPNFFKWLKTEYLGLCLKESKCITARCMAMIRYLSGRYAGIFCKCYISYDLGAVSIQSIYEDLKKKVEKAEELYEIN